ncbi:proteolipid protein 2 [Misgurnus anguillicaudatus]|uniref:proteolipid protein 2 n=1 Tax=Misgurnus anguillicaudatus TaxID=75329 RepID=UPI003CCF844F
MEILQFLKTPKGTILAAEMLLCLLVVICKVTYGCFIWSGIVELVWAVVTFVVYFMDIYKDLRFFPWTDFFRAFTGSLFLLITSLVCLIGNPSVAGEVVGNVFGMLAAVLFGYDAYNIIKGIRSFKEQGGNVGDVVII